jgi:hypothetical protein
MKKVILSIALLSVTTTFPGNDGTRETLPQKAYSRFVEHYFPRIAGFALGFGVAHLADERFNIVEKAPLTAFATSTVVAGAVGIMDFQENDTWLKKLGCYVLMGASIRANPVLMAAGQKAHDISSSAGVPPLPSQAVRMSVMASMGYCAPFMTGLVISEELGKARKELDKA